MVEVVLESSDSIAVVRMSDVELGGHADDQMLDLSQRGRVELVGKQLTGSGIAEIFAHGSDEDVLGEEGTDEFLVDLFVGVEKSSGLHERLISLDIPKGSAGANHPTLLNLVQKVSDTEAIAGSIGEVIVLFLLVRCVSSDEEVFIDLE